MRSTRLAGALAALALLTTTAGCITSLTLRDASADADDVADTADATIDTAADAGADAAVFVDACLADASACLTPPRPLAPLSTATVTSHRPTLRWALAGGDGARVDLCRDRALTTGCVPFDATGTRGAPASGLAPGVWFWRLTTRAGGATSGAPGPTWQFTVGALSAPLDLSWGSTLDVNGDGYADVAVGTENSNTAYVYLGGASGLDTTPLTVVIPAGTSGYVSSAGDVDGDGYGDFVVGAQSSNAVYVYRGSPDASSLRAKPIILNGPALSDGFGTAAAHAGDVNDDGYADLIVGAVRSNTAYVYFGASGAHALNATPVTLTAPAGSSSFGNAVSSPGDVNGDGRADLAVGAYTSNRAYVYLGGSIGPGATPIALAGPAGSAFGGSVSRAGDLNGDGYADLLVGAHLANRVYVYLGGAEAAALWDAPIILQGPAGPSGFGGGENAGDLNGDGYGDVVANGGGFNLVQVYLGGSGAALRDAMPFVVRGPVGSESFASNSAGAGDVNGDGYADFVVGAFGSSTAYVYLGHAGATPFGTTPATLIGPTGSRYGVWVAIAAQARRRERLRSHSIGTSRCPDALGGSCRRPNAPRAGTRTGRAITGGVTTSADAATSATTAGAAGRGACVRGAVLTTATGGGVGAKRYAATARSAATASSAATATASAHQGRAARGGRTGSLAARGATSVSATTAVGRGVGGRRARSGGASSEG